MELLHAGFVDEEGEGEGGAALSCSSFTDASNRMRRSLRATENLTAMCSVGTRRSRRRSSRSRSRSMPRARKGQEDDDGGSSAGEHSASSSGGRRPWHASQSGRGHAGGCNIELSNDCAVAANLEQAFRRVASDLMAPGAGEKAPSDEDVCRRLREAFVHGTRRSPDAAAGPGTALIAKTALLRAVADGDWPSGAAARAVEGCYPQFANAHDFERRVLVLRLQRLHSTLLAGSVRGEQGQLGPSLGAQESTRQSRLWADRRVREGVACSREGANKLAIQQYDAALELWPEHKEALVCRGAALVNEGRLLDALRDLDMALRLVPGDENATKYRDVARRRLKGMGVSDHSSGLRARLGGHPL